MAGNDKSFRGTYTLLFFTLFNFAALICLTVYHIQYERANTTNALSLIDSKDIFKQLVENFKHEFSRQKRGVEKQSFIDDAEVLSILGEYTKSQKIALQQECRTTCRQEVVEVLKDAMKYMKPTEAKYRRQAGAAGNELANIFGEIAKSEVDILSQYCTNGSMVCLPGEKGQPGQKGDRGVQGLSTKGDPGTTGLKGEKGDIGAVGSTGLSGPSGAQGKTGAQGTAGLPGQKGETGSRGLPGQNGTRGAQGIAGAQGIPGLDGQKGEIGNQGLPGKDGTRGVKGDIGAQGLPGEKGGLGLPGAPGIKGEIGSRGLQGTNGVQGVKGDMGARGLPGDKGGVGLPGVPGIKGEIGSRGLPGTNGTQGVKGDMGARGLPGDKGGLGLPGVPGIKGEIGTRGLPGTNGAQGVKGDMGARGMPGDKGGIGLPGVPGIKGEMGSRGIPGTNGTQGARGPKGDKGDAADRAQTLIAPPPTGSQCCTTLSVPQFINQLEEIRVPEGSDVKLNCNPSGYPIPQINWAPQVSGMDKIRTTVTSHSITINNARVSDSQLYTCTAQSALGDSQKQFNVQVYRHINFEKTPQNHTVMMGSSVTLECKVDGPLSPKVTWYKVMPGSPPLRITNNITPITNGSQLHINSVTTATAGQYICEGDNGVEKINKTASIITYGPPHIKPPGVVTAIKGQNLTIKCEAEAHPPATFTWKYPPGVTNAYKEVDGTLEVLNAQTKDATYFICIATNRYGTDQATLTLQVKVPPEVTVLPHTVPVVPGSSNIALECKVGGDPPLTVSWEKDGQPVTSDGHMFILAGNVLLVNQVTSSDYGEYKCYVSNNLGKTSSSSYAFDDRGQVSCSADFTVCQNAVCGVSCPPGCLSDPAPVIGYLQYKKESSVCKAGIQSGVISSSGGLVIWKSAQNMTSFSAANTNGVSSQAGSGTGQSFIPVI